MLPAQQHNTKNVLAKIKGEQTEEYGTTKGTTAPESNQNNNQPWTCDNIYQQ